MFNYIHRTSATGCTSTYNDSLASLSTSHGVPFPDDWPFDRKLRVEHVWDAFTLQCLLRDCAQRKTTLELPHTGEQRHRFSQAVRRRNDFIQRTGQPELSHRCNKCVRYWVDNATGIINSKSTLLSNVCTYPECSCPLEKTSCVVVDGVTVGHPCCASHNCHLPLASHIWKKQN